MINIYAVVMIKKFVNMYMEEQVEPSDTSDQQGCFFQRKLKRVFLQC